MELMGNYGRDYAKVSETNKIKQSSKSNTKTTLELNDFIKLMAAQLRNQDMNSPLNESEMMAQMAQMATMQAMNTFTDVAVTTYSASLVGKEVTLAQVEGDEVKQLIGKVTGAGLYNGKQIIFVGGKSYNLSQIMAVGELPDSEKAIRVDEQGKEIKRGKKSENNEIGFKTAHLGENGPKRISDLERVLGYDPSSVEEEENSTHGNEENVNPVEQTEGASTKIENERVNDPEGSGKVEG